MHPITLKIRGRLFLLLKRYIEAGAERKLRSRYPELTKLADEYIAKTKSGRVYHSGFLKIYEAVRKQKPREILECGTGFSTLALAYAAWENERDGHGRARVTSMEDYPEWHSMSQNLMPEFLRPYIDFCLSPKKEFAYSIFRGVGYADIPERAYDFAFIDGPGVSAPSDGVHTFDIDFIRVAAKSLSPIQGLIDHRYSTVYVFQKLLGKRNVRFDWRSRMTELGPVTQKDLLLLRRSSGRAFDHSIRFLGRTVFDLDLENEELP